VAGLPLYGMPRREHVTYRARLAIASVGLAKRPGSEDNGSEKGDFVVGESAPMNMSACALSMLCVCALSDSPDEVTTISTAIRGGRGSLMHEVTSSYQAGKTTIRILLPDRVEKSRQYPVLYVLPVEPRDEKRWGDSLLEVEKHDLHNKHGLICVFPTFSHLPWYGDHLIDRQIRQESYFLDVVVPFVDKMYPTTAKPDGRLLVGFSKSGWGAFTLLLRNPDVFGKAAAWDAPLMMERPDKYGMDKILPSGEAFEAYRVATLLRRKAKLFSREPRLIHAGYDNFREHHESAHRLMHELKIAHVYRDGPKRKHSWNSGWLSEAVATLVAEESVAPLSHRPGTRVDHR